MKKTRTSKKFVGHGLYTIVSKPIKTQELQYTIASFCDDMCLSLIKTWKNMANETLFFVTVVRKAGFSVDGDYKNCHGNKSRPSVLNATSMTSKRHFEFIFLRRYSRKCVGSCSKGRARSEKWRIVLETNKISPIRKKAEKCYYRFSEVFNFVYISLHFSSPLFSEPFFQEN